MLDQLVSDLQAIAQGLGPAIAARHWPEARRFAHNLAAIAGTAGAARLADRARCLHADCQHEDAPDASAALPEILTLIDALQATLTRHRNPPVTR